MYLHHLDRRNVVVAHLSRAVKAGHKVIEGVQRSAVYLVEKDDPRSLYVLKKLGRLKYRLAVLDAVNAQQGRHRV